VPSGRAIKLLVPEAYPKRPARAVTDLTVRFISELGAEPRRLSSTASTTFYRSWRNHEGRGL
jgi:hypothetical protein